VRAFEPDAIGVVDYGGHEPDMGLNVTVTNCSIPGSNRDHDVAGNSFELR
jgi:hypothetical protein